MEDITQSFINHFETLKIIVPDVFDIYYELYMHTISLNEVEAYFD